MKAIPRSMGSSHPIAGRGRIFPRRAKSTSAARSGFTPIELLVVITSIAILAGLLLPALGKSGENANGTLCTRNGRQISIAHKLYTDDHEGVYMMHGKSGGNPNNVFNASGPDVTWWPGTFRNERYLKDFHVMECPSVTFWSNKLALGMNYPEIGKWLSGKVRESEARRPSETVVFADAQAAPAGCQGFHSA